MIRKEKKSSSAPSKEIKSPSNATASTPSRGTPSRRHKHDDGSDDDDDTRSQHSEHSSASASAKKAARAAPAQDGDDDDVNVVSVDSLLDTVVEEMQEKRSQTRTDATAKFLELLTQNYCHDYIESHSTRLFGILERNFARGSVDECIQLCRTLSVLGTTAGDDSVLHHWLRPLRTIVQRRQSHLLRAAATDTIATLGFLFANDALVYLRFFHTLTCRLTLDSEDGAAHDSVFARKARDSQPTAEEVGHISLGGGLAETEEEAANDEAAESAAIASAVRAWTLMATQCLDAAVCGPVRDLHLPRLAALLEHDALEVRTAAGEAIAVIVSAKLRLQAAEDEGEADDSDFNAHEVRQLLEEAGDEDDDESAEMGPDHEGTILNSGWGSSEAYQEYEGHVSDQQLLSTLSDMVNDSDKHRSKSDRATQRATLRLVLTTLEDGEEPSETIRLDDTKHEFYGWPALVQLNAFRASLAQGLQMQLRKNSLLCSLLDVDFDSGANIMSHEDEKAYARSQDKVRYAQRDKERRTKSTRMSGAGYDFE